MGVAGAVVAAGVVGAVGTYAASSAASSAQTSAENNAINEQKQQFQQTQGNLAPFVTPGQGAANQLALLTGSNPGGNPLTAPLTAPITMDEATLEQTPGYQFNLTQGLKAVQNSAAARGLGVSGAALKGAATYATGLADSTYQNQFNNAVTNQTNTYNRLANLASLGENAAAQTGQIGQSTANAIGSADTGIGNAQGAADTATGASISSGATNAGNAYLLNSLLTRNGTGGGANSAGLYGSSTTG